MQRLRGPDVGFLVIECPSQPSTVVFGVRLRFPAGSDGHSAHLTIEDLRAHVAARLPMLPAFRSRLMAVPGRIQNPVLIEDPDFRLDDHLREVTLEAPGGDAEIDRLVSSWQEHRLDLRMPLWRLVLVHGVADDRQVILFVVHHAVIDGFAMHTTLARLFSDIGAPGLGTEEPPGDPESPTRRQLFGAAVRDLGRQLRSVPALVKQTKDGAAAAKERQAVAEVKVPKHVEDTDPCLFNNAFTQGRRYTRTTLALDDLRRVKDVAGVTLNDVLLGSVASATRAYLLARNDLPKRALTVNVPVSLDPPGTPPRQWGNRFAIFLGSLATDIEDPWERLLTISAVATEARLQLDLMGADTTARWLDLFPPLVTEPGARKLAAMRRRDQGKKAEYNVLVSNVKGHPELSFNGVVVEAIIPSGPTFDGAGLTVVGWSYGDIMQIGLTVNSVAVTDPEELAVGIVDGLAELVDLANARTGASLS